ncbi:TRAP transporter substrate-binding protein DctP [Corynebacterium glyciniphilum]|uniref:TRAP transporter substrate-binding protein DctP n=1 Tax=Corynebacterium glyciniphilum TaxID=1404244 RepID=UPI003D9FC810
MTATITFSTAACGSNLPVSDDGTITLRLAHAMPSSTFLVKDGIEVWMDEVTDRTDDKVQFEYYPSGQLVSAEEILTSVQSGVVHIGAFVPGNVSAELPLSDVPTVPGFDATNYDVLYKAYWDLLSTTLYDVEWRDAGLRPAMAMLSGGYQVLIDGGPRHDLNDWSGHTTRSVGGAMDFVVDELDSAPITMPGPEVYEGLQRGTLDSAVQTLEFIGPLRFDEVVSSATTNLRIGGSGAVMAISQETFDELPPDVQTAMDEASQVAMASAERSTVDQRAKVMEATRGSIDYYELTPDELAAIDPLLVRAQERWVDQRENNGLPGHEVLDAWDTALKRAAGVPAQTARPK